MMITLTDLCFGYTKRRRLFEKLNLALGAGNIYGLLGRNGAGKTTLLKLISGMRFADGGSCEVFGHPAKSREPRALARLFYVPEEFSLPPLPIPTFVSIYAPFYPDFQRTLMHQYLEAFELSAKRAIAELSYGEVKKFYIAFALATQCSLLLLDEPTNGLDIAAKSVFRKLLAESINAARTFVITGSERASDF